MNALAFDGHDDTPQPIGLLMMTRLLPGMVSALALAPAALAYELRGTLASLVVALLWIQALLLAFGTASLVAAAHERLKPWESRLAPDAARERVRARLLRDLRWMGAIAFSGPLVLGAVLDVQAGGLRLLPGIAALLSTSVCAALVWSLGWWGRAPRWLMLPAAAVLATLALPGVVRAVSHGQPLRSLALIGCAALLWRWLLTRRALAARAQPLPRFAPGVWWRRHGVHRLWRSVPYRVGPNEYKKIAISPALMLILVPQFQAHASRMEWLSWGQAYDHPYAMLGYGLWLLGIGGFTAAALIAPPLHWRQRLAPGGLSAQRWARRLVIGSMLMAAAMFSAGLAFAALTNQLPFWPVDASAWLSALGDVLLVTSFVAWQRARSTRKEGLLTLLGVVLAAPALLGVLTLLGLTPQRGLVWLLIQMALTVPLVRMAVRAWAQQDLNAMA